MDKATPFKGKLALTAAVVSAFIGYGRRSYASNPGCYLVTGSTYKCAGSATTTQSFTDTHNPNVYTSSSFSITTTTGDAISFTGNGALNFTDTNKSDITSTSGYGLKFVSTGAEGGTPGSVTINTNGSISGYHSGIYAVNAGAGNIRITTGTGSSVTSKNFTAISAHAQGTGNVVITTGAGSSVVGGANAEGGIAASSGEGDISITTGIGSTLSAGSGNRALYTVGSGSSMITNSGLILGSISLNSSINNTLTNSGTWNIAGGENYFRIGAANTITNTSSGTIIAANAGSASPVNTVFNGNITFNNAGLITSQNNLAGDRIVIQGDFIGQGGRLSIDTTLSTDGSVSDQLLINGTVAGTTQVYVNNVGGDGKLTTGDGIKIIEVSNQPNGLSPIGGQPPSTLNPDAFTLGGRAAASAYEYQLFYNGNPADQIWFLRNTLASGLPNYRMEVPVDMVMPLLAKQFGMAMLDTLDDRVGSRSLAPDSKGPWLRLIGQTGDRNNGSHFFNQGPSYHWGMTGIQAGYDLYRQTHDKGSSDIIGVDAALGQIHSKVNQVYSANKAGDINLYGGTFGAYWTHYAANQWYTDAVIQGTTYNRMHAHSILGQTLATTGQGYLASLESGRTFDAAHGFSFTPEAQIVYQQVHVGNSADDFGNISYNTPDAIYGRIGTRVSKQWAPNNTHTAPITTWTRLNLWHSFNANNYTTFAALSGENPVTLTSDIGYSWAQVSLGASGQFNQKIALFASGDYSANFAGGNGHVWAGRLGAKYVS